MATPMLEDILKDQEVDRDLFTRNAEYAVEPVTPSPTVNLEDILDVFKRRSGFPASDCSKDVLRFVIGEHREEEVREYCGINPQDYEEVLEIFEDFPDQIGQKPRLTYTHQDSTLLIEMPSELHETPFIVLTPTFQKYMDDFPGDQTHIYPSIHTASRIRNGRSSIVPDIMVSIKGPAGVLAIPVIGETAFSQSHNSVIRKLERTVEANPNVSMVLLVEIIEQPYRSPAPDSVTWQSLNRVPLPLQEFVPVNYSVTAADHTWCHITSVSFFVWTKRGTTPIDLNYDMAHGTMWPTQDMDDVADKIDEGMTLTKNWAASHCKKMSPTQTFNVIPTDINWNNLWMKMSREIQMGIADTAYDRYLRWYDAKGPGIDIPAANTRSRVGVSKPRLRY